MSVLRKILMKATVNRSKPALDRAVRKTAWLQTRVKLH